MQRKKIIIALAALGCVAVLGVGGYGILSQTTDTTSKSASAGEKDRADHEKEKTTDQIDDVKDDAALINGAATDTVAADTSASTVDTNSSTPAGNTGSSSKAKSSGSSKSDSGNTGKSGSGSSTPGSSKPTSENSQNKSAHTHSYSSSVTTQPTCTNPGVRTYTCTAGDSSYTESIPATGHKWADQYETKTIPAKTHEEEIVKQVCNGCGAQFDTAREAGLHTLASDTCENYTSKVVGTVIITDVPATTQQVYIGKKCSVCGAWQ